MTLVYRFLRDISGAASIEYGLIGTFVALMLISGGRAIGTKLNSDFQKIAGNL